VRLRAPLASILIKDLQSGKLSAIAHLRHAGQDKHTGEQDDGKLMAVLQEAAKWALQLQEGSEEDDDKTTKSVLQGMLDFKYKGSAMGFGWLKCIHFLPLCAVGLIPAWYYDGIVVDSSSVRAQQYLAGRAFC
jgi:hypothetical protein